MMMLKEFFEFRKTATIVLFILLLMVGYLNGIAKEITKDIHKFKLDNGLTVVIAEDHDKPEIYGKVVVNVGAKDGPEEATGMAHYLEHMLFKGTQKLGTTNWQKEKQYINKIYELYEQLNEAGSDSLRKQIQDSINTVSVKAQ